MSTYGNLLRAIDFKTLDFSNVTIERKVGDATMKVKPSEPVTQFPKDVDITIVNAKLDRKWVWTFDAEAADLRWKNVRSAPIPIEDVLFACVAELDLHQRESISAIWKNGIFHRRLGFTLDIMDSEAYHAARVAELKADNAIIGSAYLAIGYRSVSEINWTHATKILELYREFVGPNTQVIGGSIPKDTVKRVTDILGAKC